LHAGVAARESDNVVLGKEGVEERVAAGATEPLAPMASFNTSRRSIVAPRETMVWRWDQALS
jgi:hypothetical protein